MAAKYHKDIAELCETEILDQKKAEEHYQRAMELFEGENAPRYTSTQERNKKESVFSYSRPYVAP